MALLEIHCKKCGEDFKLDIHDMTIDEVRMTLMKKETFECPGHHVELASPLNYWEFGRIVEGSAPSQDEWLKSMRERHGELISSDELRERFNITGFCMGTAVGKEKSTGEEVYLDFGSGPDGRRYYWRL